MTEETQKTGETREETGEAEKTGAKTGRKSRRKADKDNFGFGAVFWVPIWLAVSVSIVLLVVVIWTEVRSRHPLGEWPADLPGCSDAEVAAAVTGVPAIVERWALVGAHVYEIRVLRVLEATPRHVERTDGQTRLVCDAEFYVDSADHTDEHLHDGAIEVQTLPTGETTVVWEVDGARSTARLLAPRTSASAPSDSVTAPSTADSIVGK